MPIGEFTRAFFAMNSVLEDASHGLGLSKRAAVVLLILYESSDGRMKTAELVRTLQAWKVSTGNTVSKDVSIAKGELFEQDLVIARGGIRNIELTAAGRQKAESLIEAIGDAMNKAAAGDDATSLLWRVCETVPVPRKPMNSAEIERLAKPPRSAGSKQVPKKKSS